MVDELISDGPTDSHDVMVLGLREREDPECDYRNDRFHQCFEHMISVNLRCIEKQIPTLAFFVWGGGEAQTRLTMVHRYLGMPSELGPMSRPSFSSWGRLGHTLTSARRVIR